MDSSGKILKDIYSAILESAKSGNPTRAVFDLDSTLFDVAPRFSKIISDFSKDPKMVSKYPMATEKLSQVKVLKHPYYLKDFMHKIGLIHETPEFYKEVYTYWKERFFHNDYLFFDKPEKGAVEFVQNLFEEDVHIIYLTGRDEERMGQGTLESLHKWKFPLIEEKAELFLKPFKEIEDSQYKKEELTLFPETDKIWFFENEPTNINLVHEECPHVQIVFFDSVHSGKSKSPTSFPTIQNFLLK